MRPSKAKDVLLQVAADYDRLAAYAEEKDAAAEQLSRRDDET